MSKSLAVAYQMKKKKMAQGGDIPTEKMKSRPDKGWGAITVKDKEDMMADGGEVKPTGTNTTGASKLGQGWTKAGFAEGGAIEEDDRGLNQHGEIEEGPQSGGEGFHEESYMGNPGNEHDEYQSEAHMEDMVGRIMKQRQQMFSEGGRVANEDHGPNNSRLAGFSPNEFDDLSLRDDLEFSYTGKNSGDELGDKQEDHDRSDIIARIMKSRAKKDRLPSPR